ncbi:flagellar biosynthesis protein FlhB [Pseudalkalibacillus salsuginis]|uniref:flagellar biosynthesis protein FlhB n=1 Tax=Pseudalkalibacillus salsuginis TaxID=2910972 RepID=UPI001F2C02EE|nr:flagellar biosynthesis protein FlhB [Pseudalkalibacillus salsuginis]MCF6410583.1 flagellar biosynthesis protein FlhB [Pseudalkalibacillus salsuginis]
MPNLTLDLQYFSQEKTEKATPKKKQDSRKKGQVAKSSDINTAIILLIVFLFLWLIAPYMLDTLLAIYQMSFREFIHFDTTSENIQQVMSTMAYEASKIVAPILLIAMVAGVAANYLQVGVLFSTDPLKAKLERINPLKGFKRIYSVRAIVELLKSILKISLVGFVTFAVLWFQRDEVLLLSHVTVEHALLTIGKLTVQMGLAASVLLIFLAVLDYLYQKYDFEKSIKMSKQDIKDEHKKSEGDPLIKSKIKEKQRQMAMQRMMQEVPKADVVITNPTHYAIALKYDENEHDAPVVIAKGVDFVALKIREVARHNEIEIVENRPLARSLYDRTEIGDHVPEALFKAVAEVLAYVYRLKKLI